MALILAKKSFHKNDELRPTEFEFYTTFLLGVKLEKISLLARAKKRNIDISRTNANNYWLID